MRKAFLLALIGAMLTAGPVWAGKGKLTATSDASGRIIYTQTPEAPKAAKAEDWTTPGPRYNAAGNLRGMVYDVGQKRGRASGSATYRTSTGASGRVDWETSFYCYAGQCGR